MPISTAFRLLEQRRTKIVATLGPASYGQAVLEDLVRAGVNVFRLNLSHGAHADHEEVFHRVRKIAERDRRWLGILADLSGPKIRTGAFEGGSITLTAGEKVTVTTDQVLGRPGLISSQYTELVRDVSPGGKILLDDGKMELGVVSVEGSEVRCEVRVGGELRDRKGMNLPGTVLSVPALTDKDREDARFALDLGVDFLALSFVRRAADLVGLRELMEEMRRSAFLVAKIEKPQALDAIEEILAATDGVMVARGDLGVELPPEKVPVAQTQLVRLANENAKPVIVATQMLESMIRNPLPTRAEVTDVSLAVREGADAVMLSAETASGAYPVKTVEMMDRVIRETEGYVWDGLRGLHSTGPGRSKSSPIALEEAVGRATAQLSQDLLVRCIVVFTGSGWTTGRVSAGRPQAPILSASPDEDACRRTSLLWGVVPIQVESLDPGPNHEVTRRLAVESGAASQGDYVLEVRGFHADPGRNVPTIAVCRI